MRRKGFTVIELLTTIVVLAIVSLIVTPIVIDFIKDAQEGTAKNSAYGLLDAARSYHTLEMSDKGVTSSVTIRFPEGDSKLEYHGKLPDSGTLVIEADGKTTLQVQIGNYCATKAKTTDKVTIAKKTANTCTIG